MILVWNSSACSALGWIRMSVVVWNVFMFLVFCLFSCVLMLFCLHYVLVSKESIYICMISFIGIVMFTFVTFGFITVALIIQWIVSFMFVNMLERVRERESTVYVWYVCVQLCAHVHIFSREKRAENSSKVLRAFQKGFVVSSFCLLFSYKSRPPRLPSGKASASRAEDPGFESRLRRDFWGVKSYQWHKNWHSSGYPARRLAI